MKSYFKTIRADPGKGHTTQTFCEEQICLYEVEMLQNESMEKVEFEDEEGEYIQEKLNMIKNILQNS